MEEAIDGLEGGIGGGWGIGVGGRLEGPVLEGVWGWFDGGAGVGEESGGEEKGEGGPREGWGGSGHGRGEGSRGDGDGRKSAPPVSGVAGGLTGVGTAGSVLVSCGRNLMSRFSFRAFAALGALLVLGGAVAGAVWYYEHSVVPEQQRKEAISAMLKTPGPKADPGRRIYDEALESIRGGDLEKARGRLAEVIELYPDSERSGDARRVLGEMNMDRLFARVPMPGKLEYSVGKTKQDNLHSIATRFRTTVPFIKRVNNLLGNVIHPGDRLVLYPLDFELGVDLERKRLLLVKDGRYFKEYGIVSYHLPFPSLPAETTVAESAGWEGSQRIRPDDDRYAGAAKRLQTPPRGQRSGIVFRAVPEGAEEPGVAGGATAEPGIYLSEADLDELTTVVRPGCALRFLKPTVPRTP